MALQMTDRLDNLYVDAIDRDASLMHANAVSACARWCGPRTSQSQVEAFVERQISSLTGLNDALSKEIRASWQWLSAEIGEAGAGAERLPAVRGRLIKFAH